MTFIKRARLYAVLRITAAIYRRRLASLEARVADLETHGAAAR